MFSKKKLRKMEKSHEILDRVMSRWRHHVKWWRHIKKKNTQSCAGENFGKSHWRNFENRLWFWSYAAKSRPGGKFTPPPRSWFSKILHQTMDRSVSDPASNNGPVGFRSCIKQWACWFQILHQTIDRSVSDPASNNGPVGFRSCIKQACRITPQ